MSLDFLPGPFDLLISALWIFAWWKIFTRAGWSGWWALPTCFPVIGAIVAVRFALGDWPDARAPAPFEDD